MRAIIVALAFALAATAASARDVTITLTAQEMQAWPNVPLAVEQCVSGVQIRGDVSVCKGLHSFVSAFLAKLQQEAARPAPSASHPAN